MLKHIALAGWVIESDAERTAAALRTISRGAPEECGCLHCRNFAAARTQTYGEQFQQLLSQLGVPADREAEVYELGPGERWGTWHYAGWFHAIGRVVRDPLVDESPVERPLVEFSPEFRVFFAPGRALAPEVFAEETLIQIEFEALVPWVLDEPPDAD